MRGESSKTTANKTGLNLHATHAKGQQKSRRECDLSLPLSGLPGMVFGPLRYPAVHRDRHRRQPASRRHAELTDIALRAIGSGRRNAELVALSLMAFGDLRAELGQQRGESTADRDRLVPPAHEL